MKLQFLGADHEVTGSMHFIETADLKLLVDCGMQQGRDVYVNEELPVSYSETVSYTHLDVYKRQVL